MLNCAITEQRITTAGLCREISEALAEEISRHNPAGVIRCSVIAQF